MTKEDYMKTHPEQFKDDIDKWLFLEFGIIGGCCSAEKSHEYHIARMVAEKLNDVFIEKAAIWFNNNFIVHDEFSVMSDSFSTKEEMFEDFKEYLKK